MSNILVKIIKYTGSIPRILKPCVIPANIIWKFAPSCRILLKPCNTILSSLGNSLAPSCPVNPGISRLTLNGSVPFTLKFCALILLMISTVKISLIPTVHPERAH